MTREQDLYNTWLANIQEDTLKAELSAIAGKDDEIKDRFYRDLEFGTAGLRGVLGAGTNRMNIYTVGRATQGLADFLNERCKEPKVAIAYDSRINSTLFAQYAAGVFAANGIKVHIYKELMPTPALSFAVRELGCDSGVVITASHNPAKYNGYKAYGSDGCQIGPETSDVVMANIEKTDIFTGISHIDFDTGLASGMIEYIPESFVQKYIDRVYQEAINPNCCKKADLKLVYTPLNGAGNKCVRMILAKLGAEDITVVPEQEQPDGNFPTCPYPNPEMREALLLGLDLCKKTGADMLLATDPDADRTAVAVRQNGDYRILSGNEVGVLLLDYIAAARIKNGTMPKNPITVKSIVSTKLTDAVAKEYGVQLISVLTGFKFIGEAILELEKKGEIDRYIFGYEESCGYLSGGYVRDKDAINASMLLVEMASAYKLEGKTLADRLDEIFAKHGIYQNKVDNFAFEGAAGMDKMARIMTTLRENPPSEIGGAGVIAITDYSARTRTANGKQEPICLPKSNVLEYELQNGCAVVIRPSGTEPKIKIYYFLTGKTHEEVDDLAKLYAGECSALIGVNYAFSF